MKKLIGFPLIGLVAACTLFVTGCSKGAFSYDYEYSGKDAIPSSMEADGGEGFIPDDGGEGGTSYESGVVTAGEWNDIANWSFWTKLLNNQDWATYSSYWKFYPRNFVYVELVDAAGNPACGVEVELELNGQDVWDAVSDNTGHAVLWAGIWEDTFKADPAGYTVKVDGKAYQDFEFTTATSSEIVVNKYSVTAPKVENSIDVAFIVDATGSMSDEIGFLKKDLESIIALVGQQCTAKVRTGTVFYRDEGDDYVTKFSQLTNNLNDTEKFIGKQEANGGGDWPEAVHSALEVGIQSLQWNSDARSRIAFLILDAPPHHEDAVIASCQELIAEYAEDGIKIIPVAASGIDKACEYLLRSFAMATNGTYVFITDDSGVGNEHIEATVGEYQVEKLRDLIARLIIAYAK